MLANFYVPELAGEVDTIKAELAELGMLLIDALDRERDVLEVATKADQARKSIAATAKRMQVKLGETARVYSSKSEK